MNQRAFKLMSLVALTMAFFSPVSIAANIWATVSKNKVVKNEVFQLRIVVDEKASSDDLDFSALEKDFYVSRPSFGSSINIVNGNRSVRSEWNITLAAQKLGLAKIPAFTIDGNSSKPIAIQVTQDSDEPKVSDLVELRTSLDKTQLYPNESASLRTRLIIKADPRRLQNPQVVPPKVEGLTLTQIGEPNQYQSVLDGVEVTVLDQDYRVTADNSGNYTLHSAAFKGSVIYGNDRVGTTKLVSVNIPAEIFNINVEPKPEGYSGVWLPTSMLSLKQTWTAANGEKITPSTELATKVGDSITREITLDVEGLPQERLPKLNINYPENIRVYAEKPQFSQLESGVTRMTLKQVLIPKQAGSIELPSLDLNWWDSQNKKQRTAHLEGLTLAVEPGENLNNSIPAPQYSAPVETNTITVHDAGFWPYLTALFALLWLITSVLLVRSKVQGSEPKTNRKLEPNSSSALIDALESKDYFKAQHCASQWLNQVSIDDKTLIEEVRNELDLMQKSYFSSQETGWNATNLLKLIKKVDKMPRSNNRPEEELAKL
ncbi:BatD family protein [Vibrio sp. Of14-4]|uniref:BatD family protein n=1 Tax=Vibrio sp. Of14-4 TaxID=2724878 RepID=UPI001EF1CDAA|nr:BatD family protein [Vibrio sp. Of14-4]MCG7489850.1 BatD family protein [Vibrio sp. Of14-4]